MTNLVEPRRAADEDDDGAIGSFGDGELTTLVRRWMAAGTKVQERVRRESLLRVAPESDGPASDPPDEVADEAVGPSGDDQPEVVEVALEQSAEAELEVAELEVAEDEVAELVVEPVVEPVAEEPTEAAEAPDTESDTEADTEAEVVHTAEDAADVADVLGVEDEEGPAVEEPVLLSGPPLPHRPTATDVEQATRVAVLIDARRVPEEVASALLSRLAERGAVNVCRAYADWSRSDLGDWVARLRQQGLHSFHQFADDDDQALVALAIDAVDIARDAAVDEVVIAGDMTSLLPLVHRLHAAGVRVVVVGPGHTPHDVRAACDEFWDSSAIGADDLAPAGRHRA